jgi:hypothetical protein
MVRVLFSSAADRGFEHRSGQTKAPGRVKPKNIQLAFAAKQTTLKNKSKDRLTRNQEQLFE